MGYRANGICYETSEEAMQHFLSQYPKQQGSLVYSAEYGGEGTGAGEYLVSLTDSLGNYSTGTVKFAGCNPSTVPLSDLSSSLIWLIVAGVVLWALGLSAGLKR